MTAFEPRLVQANYLHQTGFRDHLLDALRGVYAVFDQGYEFSAANERRRIESSQWLHTVLPAIEEFRPSHTLIWSVNRAVERYGLGEPFERDAVIRRL